MMWAKQLLTPEMGNEDQAGTTLRFCSEKCKLEVVALLDCNLSQLVLLMRSGEYVFQSEKLVVSPLLDRVATVQLLREGLERWLVLAMSPHSRQQSGLTPMELTTLLYSQIEHFVA